MAAVPGVVALLAQALPAGVIAIPIELSRAAELAELQKRVMPNPWSQQQFTDSIYAEHPGWLLIRQGGLIGVIVFSLVLDELELLTIAVSENEQGRGLAGLLLTCCLQSKELSGASRCTLEVMVNNVPAIKLYQALGFVQVGLRRDYYKLSYGRVDALVMQLQLSEGAFDARA